MAKPYHQLLAESLARVQKNTRNSIVQATDILRLDRERLEKEGWLTRIIKGWYLFKQPVAEKRDSTLWYASYWDFIRHYLHERFGEDFCLSAAASLNLHLGSTTIPRQLVLMVKKGGASVIDLPFNTSIAIYQETKTFPQKTGTVKGIKVMPLAVAINRSSAKLFQDQPQQAEIALKIVDTNALYRELLSSRNLASASRILGAYQFLGQQKQAKQLKADFFAAGYSIEAENPFLIQQPTLGRSRITSPYAARILSMWKSMRNDIITIFPDEPGLPEKKAAYFSQLEALFTHDAYNSLSIEGYEVSEELIKKIASGKWNPTNSKTDQDHYNAMAAKGYRQAFLAVKGAIQAIFQKNNPGKVLKKHLHIWYRELFSPSIKAGILEPAHLAGFRDKQVFIRGSMHTPLPNEALMDAMETYFKCIIAEESACVRAILGHFIFVFIHPYMDGNGRLGRFIMNAMFASGGYSWTIIPVTKREFYFMALEQASVHLNIKPLAQFVSECQGTLTGG